MSIRDDFKILFSNTSKLSLTGKFFIGISLLMSFLSIGSLADQVWKFKGFLANAISAYQAVTEPILTLPKKHLSVTIPRELLDIIVFFSLSVAAMLITVITVPEIDEEETPEWHPIATRIVAISILFTLVIVAKLQIVPWFVAVAILFPAFFLALGIGNIENRRFALFTTIYIGLIYLSLAIIAAISEGLLRPS